MPAPAPSDGAGGRDHYRRIDRRSAARRLGHARRLRRCPRNHIVTDLHRVNSIRIRMILQERVGLSAARLPVALQEHHAVLEAVARRDVAGATLALQAI